MTDALLSRTRALFRPMGMVTTEVKKTLKTLDRLESSLGEEDLMTRLEAYEHVMKSAVETVMFKAISNKSLDLSAHEYLGDDEFGALDDASDDDEKLELRKKSLYFYQWQASLVFFVFEVADNDLRLQAKSLLVRTSSAKNDSEARVVAPLIWRLFKADVTAG